MYIGAMFLLPKLQPMIEEEKERTRRQTSFVHTSAYNIQYHAALTQETHQAIEHTINNNTININKHKPTNYNNNNIMQR